MQSMPANPLAYVRDTCGKIIRLGPFETVAGLRIEPGRITLGINTAKAKPTAGFGWQVTKRGTTLYVFDLDTRTGCWALTSTMPLWWSTDELHAAEVRSRDSEWEEMCHRPGTARTPLDNYGRKIQGYN